MGILKRISAAVGILIACFILLVLAVHLGETIGTFNEKIVAAYDGSYGDAYADIYAVRYHEGYQEQYGIGYEPAYKKGYNQAYNKAYDEAYQNGLEVGHKEGLATRVALRNPTYKELKEFLARDKTDSNPYIEGKYVCVNFATDVNNNAELEGIRAAFVFIGFPMEGHTIVAFETVDKGLVFIEPQSDRVAKPAIGKRYWSSAGDYQPRNYDDTIIEIQILW